ncbi:uncharacterized protein A4U43_C05F15170 [Asparagus officinalis]|uniref:Major facilitator superfamily (MFS) profile domain-containing protein n=1 Tax=Asparagus officinalis TaxID=4686 RepID=A0A5P1EUA0_ASPOF|nr:uncharacterized protein A4U43_C05F15170 [Asparagus officinalis]
MVGAIPAALTFYWRMSMPETARYTALVENDVNKAKRDIARVLRNPDLDIIDEESETVNSPVPKKSYGLFSKEFLNNHGRDLFACAMTWLIVDIPFYAATLYSPNLRESGLKPPRESRRISRGDKHRKIPGDHGYNFDDSRLLGHGLLH